MTDTIILAAGRGTRLDGIAAPFHKPLIPVQGRPLVSRVVDQALRYSRNVVVVVAPENAAPISAVLGDRNVTLVVQRTPNGPGAGLLVGLQATRSERVQVLMADNVISDDDIDKFWFESRHTDAIGTGLVSTTEAARFTRLVTGEQGIDDAHVFSREGSSVEADEVNEFGSVRVWLGPLHLQADRIVGELATKTFVGELKIGPWLGSIAVEPALVDIDAYDVGIPEAIK